MNRKSLIGAVVAGALAATSVATVQAQTSSSVLTFTSGQDLTNGGDVENVPLPNSVTFSLLVGQNQSSFSFFGSFVSAAQLPTLFVQQVNSVWVADAAGDAIAILCGTPSRSEPPPPAFGSTLVNAPISANLFLDNSAQPCTFQAGAPNVVAVFQEEIAFANTSLSQADVADALAGATLVISVTKSIGGANKFEYDDEIREGNALECPKPPKPPKPPRPPKPPKPPVKPGKPGQRTY